MDFKLNDVITYGDNGYVVIENFGDSGRVQENRKKGAILKIAWDFRGEKCVLKPGAADNRELEDNDLESGSDNGDEN